jgi:hypothetical protein
MPNSWQCGQPGARPLNADATPLSALVISITCLSNDPQKDVRIAEKHLGSSGNQDFVAEPVIIQQDQVDTQGQHRLGNDRTSYSSVTWRDCGSAKHPSSSCAKERSLTAKLATAYLPVIETNSIDYHQIHDHCTARDPQFLRGTTIHPRPNRRRDLNHVLPSAKRSFVDSPGTLDLRVLRIEHDPRAATPMR